MTSQLDDRTKRIEAIRTFLANLNLKYETLDIEGEAAWLLAELDRMEQLVKSYSDSMDDSEKRESHRVGDILELAKENDALERRVRELETALQSVEWTYSGSSVCPTCRMYKRHGHAINCALVAALRESGA